MKSCIRVFGLAGLVIMPFLNGCGSSGPKELMLKGKVHRNGEVLQLTSKVPGGSLIELGFHGAGDGAPKDPRFPMVDPATGAFTMSGKGVTPGKYKISVHQYDPRPDDKLKGAFSKEKTPIVLDITAEGDIDIDLAKYEKK